MSLTNTGKRPRSDNVEDITKTLNRMDIDSNKLDEVNDVDEMFNQLQLSNKKIKKKKSRKGRRGRNKDKSRKILQKYEEEIRPYIPFDPRLKDSIEINRNYLQHMRRKEWLKSLKGGTRKRTHRRTQNKK
jgi:hypothetical protein